VRHARVGEAGCDEPLEQLGLEQARELNQQLSFPPVFPPRLQGTPRIVASTRKPRRAGLPEARPRGLNL
jgi:hypothetical protein